jgi:hypothetical protein
MPKLKVNKKRIQNFLRYLCKNNPSYIKYGIKINNQILNSLPENEIPNDLNFIDEPSQKPEDDRIGSEIVDENAPLDDYHAFVEQPFEQTKEADKIKQKAIKLKILNNMKMIISMFSTVVKDMFVV